MGTITAPRMKCLLNDISVKRNLDKKKKNSTKRNVV